MNIPLREDHCSLQIIRETPFAVLFERSDSNTDELLTHGEFRHFFGSFDSNGR